MFAPSYPHAGAILLGMRYQCVFSGEHRSLRRKRRMNATPPPHFDVVISVGAGVSGIDAATGFASESGLRYRHSRGPGRARGTWDLSAFPAFVRTPTS